MSASGLARALCALWLLAACDGEPATLGLDQPLWVTGGAFKSGRLPGDAPLREAPAADSGERTRLALTSIETNNTVLHPGQADKRVSGRATDDGYSVALRFEGLGDGYWVKPLEETDSAYPGELSFRINFQLAAELPLGEHRLLFVVIDGKGRAGRQQALPLCIASRSDVELHACDETKPPPAATITLSWDSRADLDLQVQTPDGDYLDAAHPSTPDQRGVLYADRHAGCADGEQREDLVFAADVPPGRYRVFVNSFDACGELATFFEISAYARSQDDDGSYRFRRVGKRASGELLDIQANGGREDGVWVVNVDFP